MRHAWFLAVAALAPAAFAQDGTSWSPLTCAEVERGSLEAALLDCEEAAVEPGAVDVAPPPAGEPVEAEVPEVLVVEPPESAPEVVAAPEPDGVDVPPAPEAVEVTPEPEGVEAAPEPEEVDVPAIVVDEGGVELPEVVEAPAPDVGDAVVFDEVEARPGVVSGESGDAGVPDLEAAPAPQPPGIEPRGKGRGEDGREREERGEGRERAEGGNLGIPNGHLPPPGSCRVWFPDRPAGQQPPPGPCDMDVPPGAALIRG